MIAIIHLQRGIPSKRKSSACIPTFGTIFKEFQLTALLSISIFALHFFRFIFSCSLRAKQTEHDTVMNEIKNQRDQHRDHKHAVIYKQAENSSLRRVLRQWKLNVDSIHGRRTVHTKLQAAQEEMSRMQEATRVHHQTIERLRVELTAAKKRNEMLEIVAGP